jgi:hypothetical protein
MITVRNRLAITKKCITAIQKHTTIPFQLYIYDNQTNYKINEHFEYFCNLYKRGLIAQVTFNTDVSTFNAFSKAASSNSFGLQHENDPKKDSYDFLVMLDNDVIVTPEWDKYVKIAWDYIKVKKLDHIKVVGQLPGGIKSKVEKHQVTKHLNGAAGVLGGSGLWCVNSDFYRTVGFLDLKLLVGHSKKHDQNYWSRLAKSSFAKPYILGLNKKLGIHCGKMAGSVCNRLTASKNKNEKEKLDLIKFEKAEEIIDKLKFDEFFKSIYNDKALIGDW